MKLKDTFMSSLIWVKILKYQYFFKKFPFALQTILSLHNLEADNFFLPTTACEQLLLQKGNPPIKNDGPSLIRTTMPISKDDHQY